MPVMQLGLSQGAVWRLLRCAAVSTGAGSCLRNALGLPAIAGKMLNCRESGVCTLLAGLCFICVAVEAWVCRLPAEHLLRKSALHNLMLGKILSCRQHGPAWSC